MASHLIFMEILESEEKKVVIGVDKILAINRN